jgi:putative DNA primase/helicase
MTIADAINDAEQVRDEIDELVKKAEADPGAPFAPDIVKRLAALRKTNRARFETLRAQLKKAGARVSALDEVIDAGDDDVAGPVPFPAVELWPDPVDGGNVLTTVARHLKRYISFANDEQPGAVALWVAFAWVHDAFPHSPILLVSSAERDSGKSTLLAVVGFMLPRTLASVEMSEAVLYRAIAKWKPTLICDEADVLFKDNAHLRAVMNSGWMRGSGVMRCHPETLDPELFPTFGPKAIGMKGRSLPDTTFSRAILIEMRRKKAAERVDDFRHVDDPELADIRRKLARWAEDNAAALEGADPALPAGFCNRLAANWRPLLAIADLVGGKWSAFARMAAAKLSPRDPGSVGTTLLADIRQLFDEAGADKLASEDVVERLHKIEGRPWAEWGRLHKPLTKNNLAYLLREYKIASGKLRVGSSTPNGYSRASFEEAWERYLATPGGPSEPPPSQPPSAETEHRNNADGMGTSSGFGNGTPDPDVPFQKCEKPLRHSDCSDVPFQNPLRGEMEPKPGAAATRVCSRCNGPGDERDRLAFYTDGMNGSGPVWLHRLCAPFWFGTRGRPDV